MTSTLSIVVNHTPWRPERAACLRAMLNELRPLSRGLAYWVNDVDHRGRDWQVAKVDWALDQWRWAARGEGAGATHHLFCTDDLALAPGFVDILLAMIEAAPAAPIGLLSNHPRACELADAGAPWYATNSWIVGPAYVLPHALLVDFLAWFEALPDGPHTTRGTKAWANDDSSINEWITFHGPTRTLHPLPTIVEHDPDGATPSTVGHGDEYSRERVSWRRVQHPASGLKVERAWPLEDMKRAEYWRANGGPDGALMLQVGG